MIQILTLILEILIMSAFCHGIQILFWENMIFGKTGMWYNSKYSIIDAYDNHKANMRAAGFNAGLNMPIIPKWTDYFVYYGFKPIIGCVICYASFWGTIAFVGLHLISGGTFSYITIPEWIIACVCTAFVNYKLNKD